MRDFSRGTLKLLLAGALVAVLSPAPQVQATGLRDFELCIQKCDQAREACGERCTFVCNQIFPTNTEKREACLNSCNQLCDFLNNICTQVCEHIRDDVSPDAP